MSDQKGLPIEVRHLHKVYHPLDDRPPVVAIEELSFTVAAGETICIVGETGCGKSTLFNILTGLTRPSRGQARIENREPYQDFDWFQGKIGIVFQQDRLLPWRTALQNAELGLEMQRLAPAVRRQRAQQWLVRLGLGDALNRYPAELSGGMRQRVSMARAFALSPRLILADEAFSRLDEVTARQLRSDFLQVTRAEGTTVVVVTHQLEEAIEVGERILVFGKPGRLLMEVHPQQFLRSGTGGELREKLRQAMGEGSRRGAEARCEREERKREDGA